MWRCTTWLLKGHFQRVVPWVSVWTSSCKMTVLVIGFRNLDVWPGHNVLAEEHPRNACQHAGVRSCVTPALGFRSGVAQLRTQPKKSRGLHEAVELRVWGGEGRL